MSIPLGKPIVVVPYKPRGCLDRLRAWLLWLLRRLLLAGLGVLLGYLLGSNSCG